MLWLLASLPAAAGALVGLDYVPFGRADLAWVDAGQLSGDLVGEFDGLSAPALSAWGGWASGRHAALVGLGGARIATFTTTSGVVSGSMVAVLRPSADYRYYVVPVASRHPEAWVQAGAYGDIPAARTAAATTTDAEQEAIDAADSETQARLGGWGLRAGGGASVTWENGLGLGFRYMAVFHRSASVAEDVKTTSTLLTGEAALELSLRFP